MKKFLLLTSMMILAGTPLVAQENLLKNPEFEGTGEALPTHWGKGPIGKVRRIPAPAGTNAKFAIEITKTAADDPKPFAYAIQANLDIKKIQNYTYTAQIFGTKGTEVEIYVEANNPGRTCMSQTVVCDGESWLPISLDFYFPEVITKPYAVVRLRKPGTFAFANPKIVPDNTKFGNGSFDFGEFKWIFDHASIVEAPEPYGSVVELKNLNGPASIRQTGIAVKANQHYKITYEASGGTDKQYTDVQGATWFRITPQINGKPIPGTEIWRDSFPNWQQKKLTFKLDQDAVIDIVGELKSPGTVRFDNITFQPCKSEIPPLEIVLDPPCSHGNSIFLPDHENLKQVTGILAGEVTAAKYTIEFLGKKHDVKGLQNPQPFALDCPKKPGKYPMAATAFDQSGKTIATASLEFAVHPPTPKRKVTFRDDRIMLIDGQPFFPLGIWSVQGSIPLEERLKRMVDAGFNMGKCPIQLIDTYAKAGLYAVASVPPSLPTTDSPEKLESWKKKWTWIITRASENPNVIAYFNIDEPCWNGRPYEPIQEAYHFVKSIDPYHPMYLNEAPRSTLEDLRHYAAASDAYGVDIYPIPSPNAHSDLPDKTMTSVGKYTDISDEVVRSRKPVWMTLQGFSWNGLRSREPIIYPSHEQNRFMAYNSIVHGATGLFYWGFNWTTENWTFIEELGRTIRELRDISGILVARTLVKTLLKPSADTINTLQKFVGNDIYVIAINESDQVVKATFSATKLPAAIHLPLDGTQIKTSNNAFTDDFKPYDVKIYSTTPKLPPPQQKPPIPATQPQSYLKQDDFSFANWIWFKDKNKVASHQTFFIRDIAIPKNAKKVELQITADDHFQAFIDSKLVLEHADGIRGHNTVSVLDITKQVAPGKHRIQIHAADGGQPPCAMLYVVGITTTDNEIIRIVSDDQTLASETKDANWLKPNFVPTAPNWTPAAILGKYGCAPWGHNAYPEPADTEDLGKEPFPPPPKK